MKSPGLRSFLSLSQAVCCRSIIAMSVLVIANYINGAFVPPTSGKYLSNPNPATGEELSKVPDSNAADVDKAVGAAKAAFKPWKNTTVEYRARLLETIADAVEAKLEEFAQMESRDSGKCISLSRAVDIPRCVANFRFFAGQIRYDHLECFRMADAINYTMRAPLGVAGLITPWNLPLYLLSWKIAPALACGNTVVAKPSEITPCTAFMLAQVMHDCGLPAGVFNVVHGLGGSVGSPLVCHPDVPLISFTGGTVTGRIVNLQAAERFKKISLELGGKNATVVMADCDFDKTVAGAYRAAFANNGQVCLCGSRMFIERAIYEKFVAALVVLANKNQPADPLDPKTSNGSLSSSGHRDKVESFVKLGVEEGGKVECGGKRPVLAAPYDKGAFYPPTIISGLSPISSRCATEEIFGPVITVHPFDTDDEVLDYINGSKYGLAGSIWTNNLQRANRFTREMESGILWVNCWLHRDLRTPFGGVKDSGLGREGGLHSLDFFSELKNICIHDGDSK